MADKKSDRRFTLQFNKKDPAHCQVADILNRLEWRGKAQFVVNAVLYYMNRGKVPEAHRSATVDEKHIEAVVNRILRSRVDGIGAGLIPAVPPAGIIEKPPQIDTDDVFEEAVEILGEEGLCAIAGALDMFRKK